MTEGFAGDKKKGQSVLGPIERRFIDWGVPKIPKPIMSQHLTYLTILWSAGAILFGSLARFRFRRIDGHWILIPRRSGVVEASVPSSSPGDGSNDGGVVSFVRSNKPIPDRVLRRRADGDSDSLHRTQHVCVLCRNRTVLLGCARDPGGERRGVPRYDGAVESYDSPTRLCGERRQTTPPLRRSH